MSDPSTTIAPSDERPTEFEFEIMPAPEGTCPECATPHEVGEPHNAQSLHYQYTFHKREGRWPTWADAMTHCSPETRETWTQGLIRAGVDVEGGGIHPQR
jgi:hypothetical protein